MSNRVHLTTWVSRDSKDRFAAVARAQDISESALLRRIVESFLVSTGANAAAMEGRVIGRTASFFPADISREMLSSMRTFLERLVKVPGVYVA